MRRGMVCLLLAIATGGCSGGYALRSADCLAPAGGEAPVVVRLLYRELPYFTPAAEGAALRFQLPEGPIRAGRTNHEGFASASLPAPAEPGVYPLNVWLQDMEGEEARWQLRVFVLDARKPLIAVDLDAVLHRGGLVPNAAEALARLATRANILYLTDASLADFPDLRRRLDYAELPPGPILAWGWTGWRWKRRVSSPLPGLREVFAGLDAGIAGSRLAVEAFDQAGMTCHAVGGTDEDAPGRTTWARIADEGLH